MGPSFVMYSAGSPFLALRVKSGDKTAIRDGEQTLRSPLRSGRPNHIE